MTEEEALDRVLTLGDIHRESHIADKLRENPGEFFDCNFACSRPHAPAFIAICTYFAVRGGASVMREETAEERQSRIEEHDSVNYG